MADFLKAQEKVKKHEGGYQNNPNDRGNYIAVGTKNGRPSYDWAKRKDGKFVSPYGGKVYLVGTKYGVAAPTLANFLGRMITAEEMKNLDYNTVLQLFKTVYWDTIRGDQIKDQSVAEILYDAQIQHSPQAVAKIVSDSIGREIKIPLKAHALDSINGYSNQEELFSKIKTAREKYYKSLNDPSFEKGWLKRLSQYTYSGIKQAVAEVKEAASGAKKVVLENPGLSVAGAIGLTAAAAVAVSALSSSSSNSSK
jgi:lysozyme family protein